MFQSHVVVPLQFSSHFQFCSLVCLCGEGVETVSMKSVADNVSLKTISVIFLQGSF